MFEQSWAFDSVKNSDLIDSGIFYDNFIFDYYEKKKEVADGNDNKTKVLHSFFSKTTEINKTKTTEINNTQKYLTNIDESFLETCLKKLKSLFIDLDLETIFV